MVHDLTTLARWSARVSSITSECREDTGCLPLRSKEDLANAQENLLQDLRSALIEDQIELRARGELLAHLAFTLDKAAALPGVSGLSEFSVDGCTVCHLRDTQFPQAWLQRRLSEVITGSNLELVEGYTSVAVDLFGECERRAEAIEHFVADANARMRKAREAEMPSAAGQISSMKSSADNLVLEGCLTPAEASSIQDVMDEARRRLDGLFRLIEPPKRPTKAAIGTVLMALLGASFRGRNSVMSQERAAHYCVGFASRQGFALHAGTLRRLPRR